MAEINWICQSFKQLSSTDLYAILRLRTAVFVVEQNCLYQDMDNHDQAALHLCGRLGEQLLCYARLFAPGLKYPEASIGRVITSPAVRGKGLGELLMGQAISQCDRHWPGAGITISAQQHLQKFYTRIGFVAVSRPYLEDGIPHIKMQQGKAAQTP